MLLAPSPFMHGVLQQAQPQVGSVDVSVWGHWYGEMTLGLQVLKLCMRASLQRADLPDNHA